MTLALRASTTHRCGSSGSRTHPGPKGSGITLGSAGSPTSCCRTWRPSVNDTSPLQNLAASFRARLQLVARERGDEFQFVLTSYVIERLLYRLSRSPFRDHFVLKGATLFMLWSGWLPTTSHLGRRPARLPLSGAGRAADLEEATLGEGHSHDGKASYGAADAPARRHERTVSGIRRSSRASGRGSWSVPGRGSRRRSRKPCARSSHSCGLSSSACGREMCLTATGLRASRARLDKRLLAARGGCLT